MGNFNKILNFLHLLKCKILSKNKYLGLFGRIQAISKIALFFPTELKITQIAQFYQNHCRKDQNNIILCT